ncbi:MAG: trypsin-like serine protease [FCB group bacterium]|nr:trypsin-like serine protease [FCB group bacterium]
MIKKAFGIVFIMWLFVLSYTYISRTSGAPAELNNLRQTAITLAIEKVSPAVVGINVTQLKKQRTGTFGIDPFWGNFFPQTRTYKVESLGSGVVISSDGYIVTNAHVVEDAYEIIVTFAGGHQAEGELVGTDKLTDIALIKVDGEDHPYAEMGDSEDLMVGEWAIALGNPLGLFNVGYMPTATVGIISGLHMDFGQKGSGQVYQNMIQTDASINPGNSGGPLVNALGEVIGINTFIMTGQGYSTGSIGIGFAIPIGRVKTIADELKQYGKIERNFVTGVQVQAINSYLQKYLRLPTANGVIVTDIEKYSSGEKSGLEIGDIILQVEDQDVNSRDDIIRVIDEHFHKVGDIVKLKVLREGKTLDLQLELAERK